MTKAEREAKRKADDLVRISLYDYDQEQRKLGRDSWALYEWTIKQLAEGTEPMAAAKRGRPAAKKQASQATGLLEALAFVSVGKGDLLDYMEYVRLSGNMLVSTNKQISAGHPIAEELTLCPQLDRFEAALKRAGSTLLITETPGGQLSVKGEKITVLVPCMLPEDLPSVFPDPACVPMTDKLKEVLNIAGCLATEAGRRVIEASVLLRANDCTGTNGAAMVQVWHGIDLPPDIILPKKFITALAQQTKPITGFGFSWSSEGTVGTVTIWFEGGAWIKTQCYQDRWPPIDHILNVPYFPMPTPPDLFEGIKAVSEHADDEGEKFRLVTFGDDKVMSHRTDQKGAQYSVPGLQGGKRFNGKLIVQVAKYAANMDLTTYPDRALFSSEENGLFIRGVILGLEVEGQPQPERPSYAPQPAPEPFQPSYVPGTAPEPAPAPPAFPDPGAAYAQAVAPVPNYAQYQTPEGSAEGFINPDTYNPDADEPENAGWGNIGG